MKKILMALIIASFALFAQADESFNGTKKMMIESSKIMIPYLQKTRNCFAKAGNKNQALKCAKIMEEASKKLSQKMGIKDDDAQEDESFDKGTSWNAAEKKKLLANLDQAIMQSKISQKCAKESNSYEKFGMCLSKNGVN